MTRRTARTRLRFHVPLWTILLGGLACIVVLSVLVAVWKSDQTVIPRTTVLLAGDPMLLWSWDKEEGKGVIVKIPASVLIEGIHGYGRYSLEALWKLGTIEKKDGSLLTTSLQETLGIPVIWYVGPKDAGLSVAEDPFRTVTRTFSLTNLVPFLTRRYSTNMPVWAFMSLVLRTQFVGLERVSIVGVQSSLVLAREQLPDGSEVSIVDTNAVDTVIGNLFEEARIRKERISVAILNTTSTPALGTRVARLLNHIGALVVAVGNDTPAVDACIVSGKKETLDSFTARVVIALLGCDASAREEGEGRADLTIRLGRVYERVFMSAGASPR